MPSIDDRLGRSHRYFEEIERSRVALQQREKISDESLRDIGIGLWLRNSYIEFQGFINGKEMVDTASDFIGYSGENVNLFYMGHIGAINGEQVLAAITEHYLVDLKDEQFILTDRLDEAEQLEQFVKRTKKIKHKNRRPLVWTPSWNEIGAKCKVDDNDIDLFEHLNNARYHIYFESGIQAVIESYEELHPDILKKAGCRFLITKSYMEYKSQVKAGEEISMHSRLEGYDESNGLRFYMTHRIMTGEKIIAMGVTEHVCLSSQALTMQNPFIALTLRMDRIEPDKVLPLKYVYSIQNQSDVPYHQNLFKPN